MRCYNLYFISQLENDRVFERTDAVWAERNQPFHLKSHEKNCVAGVVRLLFPLCPSPAFFEGFAFSYTIPHIGKEFDLLKISEHGILNIELKSSNVGKKNIREQLLKNKYYLSHLSKPVTLFTYVHKGDLFFTLDENEKLVCCSPHEVALALSLFAGGHIEDLDPLFKAGQYLISPVGEPERFIAGNYFLTQHQRYAKNKILSANDQAFGAVAITGSVGTGKTLLLYDLCKTLAESGKRCLFIYPGDLKEGHRYLDSKLEGVNVRSLSEMLNTPPQNFDCVFVDEVNKMPRRLFDQLLLASEAENLLLFVTYDPDGYTSLQEKASQIPGLIECSEKIKKVRLTNTIRTNERLLTFAKALFENKKPAAPLDHTKIKLLYCPESALESTLLYYTQKGYALFSCQTKNVDITLPVSFSESEKAVIMVGESYCYSKGRLSCLGFSKTEEQVLLGRLKRALLRVREELVLVVSDPIFYSQLLTFFENTKT
jgi:hypothetical protein